MANKYSKITGFSKRTNLNKQHSNIQSILWRGGGAPKIFPTPWVKVGRVPWETLTKYEQTLKN